MADADRALTVRLPAGTATDLKLVARLDQRSETSIIRTALERYLSARIAQPDFQERLQAEIDILILRGRA